MLLNLIYISCKSGAASGVHAHLAASSMVQREAGAADTGKSVLAAGCLRKMRAKP